MRVGDAKFHVTAGQPDFLNRLAVALRSSTSMCRADAPVNRNSCGDFTSSMCQFNCAPSQPTNKIAVDLNPGAKSIRTLLILARRWCDAG